MRRWLAIPMLLLFFLPLVSGFLGAGVSDASLPACCRRNGKHSCSMMGEASPENSRGLSAVRDKCPCSPAGLAVLVLPAFTPGASAAIYAGLVQHPAVASQTEARRRISYDRSRQKRGPPSPAIAS
jgi:hypothetical protein